ncbi:MAG: dUTP diphosphatase [Chloroflexota bacterium]|nr:MAG: dUTP diphosphatase [Chloroflexota bacterium]
MKRFSQSLEVTIKRIDISLPLPTYATPGSVGFDLLCREDTGIAPRTLGRIPANVIVQTPPGYMLLVTLRNEAVTVQRGERIAQGMFVPIMQVNWNEVDEVGKGRGGFGSTGA